MPLAISSRSFGPDQPLEEDIRLAAVSGFAWLVLDRAKMQMFLDDPEFDIRDLNRLFLRTKPAALDGLTLPSPDSAYLDECEMLCKAARRINAPVLVVRCDAPDAGLVAFGDVAQKWSTVLAVAAPAGTWDAVAGLIAEMNHPAIGLYLDVTELQRGGEMVTLDQAMRVIGAAVGDESADGLPVLPGDGIVPVAPLLVNLKEGGFAGLLILDVPADSVRDEGEAWASQAKAALDSIVQQLQWDEII